MKATIELDTKTFDRLIDLFGNELTGPLMLSKQRATIYLLSREKGTCPKMALMFACRQAPEARTGKQWFSGNKPFWQQYDAKMTNNVAKACERTGHKLGRNDDYIPWLAKYPGDPDAIIRAHESPRERIKRANQLLLEHQERQTRKPRVPLRDDLIEEMFDKLCEEHPELRRAPPKEKRKIRTQIIRKHAFRGEELQLQE